MKDQENGQVVEPVETNEPSASSEPSASYADEAALWSRLARLLPSREDAAEFQDCWEIGEQEAGLQFVLLPRLLAQGVAIGETTRAELAVLAGEWGMWDALGAEIARCPGDPAQDGSLRLVEFEYTAHGGEPLTTEVREPDTGLLLVPWIACTHCGQVLARAHRREEWGDLSYLPESYVVFDPDGGPAPGVFAQDSVWGALHALRTACPGLGGPPGLPDSSDSSGLTNPSTLSSLSSSSAPSSPSRPSDLSSPSDASDTSGRWDL